MRKPPDLVAAYAHNCGISIEQAAEACATRRMRPHGPDKYKRLIMELKTVLVRSENQMSTPVDQELVILNLARDNYISLDEVGRRIWELLETQCRVEDLCRQLSQEFDATAEQISADVLPFLKELESEGLVRVVEK